MVRYHLLKGKFVEISKKNERFLTVKWRHDVIVLIFAGRETRVIASDADN